MTKLSALFWTFARVGALTFGGGYAMLPMFERELVEKQGWVDQEEILDYFAIGQCTPGLIAVNTATFVGYKQRGVAGGIVATLGLIAPSIVIILIIAALLTSFADEPVVRSAFAGIRVAVGVLLINAVAKLIKSNVKDAAGIILCVLAFALIAFAGVSPVFVVLGAALTGIVRGRLKNK